MATRTCKGCGDKFDAREVRVRFGKSYCPECAETMDEDHENRRKDRNVPYERASLWPMKNR